MLYFHQEEYKVVTRDADPNLDSSVLVGTLYLNLYEFELKVKLTKLY